MQTPTGFSFQKLPLLFLLIGVLLIAGVTLWSFFTLSQQEYWGQHPLYSFALLSSEELKWSVLDEHHLESQYQVSNALIETLKTSSWLIQLPMLLIYWGLMGAVIMLSMRSKKIAHLLIILPLLGSLISNTAEHLYLLQTLSSLGQLESDPSFYTLRGFAIIKWTLLLGGTAWLGYRARLYSYLGYQMLGASFAALLCLLITVSDILWGSIGLWLSFIWLLLVSVELLTRPNFIRSTP